MSPDCNSGYIEYTGWNC